MSTNTHDRTRDHHGTDLDTNVLLDGVVGDIPSGSTVHAALLAVLGMGQLPRYASAPHSGTETEGESYYDTALHKSRTWDGSAWQNWW